MGGLLPWAATSLCGAVVGTVHFWWSVKKDVTEPAIYALVFAVLLGWRVFAPRRRPRDPTVTPVS